MKSKRLSEILERVESWSAHAQDELAEIAGNIDAGLKGEIYKATPEELVGIDRGLRDAAEGRFATDDEVERRSPSFRRP